MRERILTRYICMLLALLPALAVMGVDYRPYRLDIGLQGGGGYYVGDATPHIFNNPLDVYGFHLRYKFDKRWSLQAKTMRQRITYRSAENNNAIYYNAMWNTDICAEFNFFRFGVDEYDHRMKPITPYIFLGFGIAVMGRNATTYQYPLFIKIDTPEGEPKKTIDPSLACYLPFGFGVKWKFAERWQLHLAWQHNFYFTDRVEGLDEYDNTYNLNGSNFLNNDLTGQLTLGIVFELAKDKKVCRWCDEE